MKNLDALKINIARLIHSLKIFLLLIVFHATASAQITPAYTHDSSINTAHADWMRLVPGTRLLKDLSMPGTHDAMSFYGGDIVQTQSLPLMKQLEAGIRVLDIRCRGTNNKFTIYHGIAYQYANFDDVLTVVTNFLQTHNTETVLLKVGEELSPINSSLSFSEIFNSYWSNPQYSRYFWKPITTNPKLDDIRGKIVVLQNFSGNIYGLNYASLNVQDPPGSYYYTNNWELHGKWQNIKQQLLTTNKVDRFYSNAVYLNSLPGSGGSFPYFVASGKSSPGTGDPLLWTGLTTPGFSSYYPDFPRLNCFIGICGIYFYGMNPLASNFIQAANLAYVGILMMDFPGFELIDRIVSLNTGVRIYSDWHYLGGSQVLQAGRYDIGALTIGANTLSSIHVPTGWKVTLYQYRGFQGKAKVLTADNPFLSDFNDMTSSIVVEKL